MNTLNILASSFIKIIHVGVVLFIVVVPFLKKIQWTVALLHVTSVVSLLVHWYVDEDTCFLTLLESMLLGIDTKTSFMHRLVSPIYKIQDKDLKRLVWIVTPILGLITLTRLYNARNLIKREILLMYKEAQRFA